MMNGLKKGLTYLLVAGGLASCEKNFIEPPEYENDKIIYQENVSKLNSRDFSKIKSISGDTINFDGFTKFQKGDIILGGISPKTPNGIMKKVESVEGNSVITSNASLEEVIKYGDIHSEKNLSMNDISDNSLKAGNWEYNFHKPLNKILYDMDEDTLTTNDQARLIGDIYFNSGFSFDASFNNKILEMETNSYINGIVDARVEGELDKEFKYAEELFKINFTPVPIGTTGLIVTPKFSVEAGVLADINGNFILPFYCKGDISGKILYNNGDWLALHDKTLEFDSNGFEFNLDTYARGHVAPRLTLNFNGIVGPFMEVEKYAELEFDYQNKFKWDIDCGINLNLGCDAGLLSFLIPEHKEGLFNHEVNVASGEFLEDIESILKVDNKSGNAPLLVNFDGSFSKPKDKIVEYLFEFGDGNIYLENEHAKDGAFDGKTNYTYENHGKYRTRLIVTDSKNRTHESQLEIIVNNSNVTLKSDDGTPETYLAYPGFCKEKYQSETPSIEKNFEISNFPFTLNEIQIMFSKKPTNNSNYILSVFDNATPIRGFEINYNDVKLNEWYSITLDETIQINNKLLIYGYNKSDPINCNDPNIHGWGIAVDADNSGNSFQKNSQIDYGFYVHRSHSMIDGEFLIRAIGR